MARHSAAIAKITGPRPARKVVSRERLFERIDSYCGTPAVWITGPGGSGKTTLISNYFESRERPAIWYHIDAGDADIATLFHYIGLAAKKALPDAESLPPLTPEYAGSLQT